MKRFIIILCFFLLILVSSCQLNNNEKEDNDVNLDLEKKDENSFVDEVNYDDINMVYENKTGNQANGDELDYDRDSIYYINENKLYSIDRNGGNKKILFDKFLIWDLKIYKDRIYLSYWDEDKKMGICSVKKDGTDLKIIDMSDINSPRKIYMGFLIYNDYIYYFFEDGDLLSEVKRYSIADGRKDDSYNFEEYIFLRSANPIIYNEKLYLINSDNNIIEYDSIDGTRHIQMKQFARTLQIRDNYFYYNTKTNISRYKIDGLSSYETIFENNDFIISYINVTDKYIFFVNRINDYEENKTDIQLYRMKHDGSDMQIIYEEKIEYTNIGPQYIFIIDDVLLYRNQLTDKITAMDFEGNILNWDL